MKEEEAGLLHSMHVDDLAASIDLQSNRGSFPRAVQQGFTSPNGVDLFSLRSPESDRGMIWSGEF